MQASLLLVVASGSAARIVVRIDGRSDDTMG